MLQNEERHIYYSYSIVSLLHIYLGQFRLHLTCEKSNDTTNSYCADTKQ